MKKVKLVVGAALLIGCGSFDDGNSVVDGSSEVEMEEQIVMYQKGDGSVEVKTIRVPAGSFQAELTRKIELRAALERGEEAPEMQRADVSREPSAPGVREQAL